MKTMRERRTLSGRPGRGAAPFLEAGLVVLVAVSAVMLALYAVRSSSAREPSFLLRPHKPPTASPRVVILPADPESRRATRRAVDAPGRGRKVALPLVLPPGLRAELAAARQTVIVRLDLIASPEGGIQSMGGSKQDASAAAGPSHGRAQSSPDSGTTTAEEDPDGAEGSPSPEESPSPSPTPDDAPEDAEGGP